jgi:uncharacterized membrane protein HdeD (DUF308 family)
MIACVQGVGPLAKNDTMSALLAQNWWAIASRGVFALIFGIVALLMLGATILALVLLFAAYMLVDGVCDIIAAVRAARQHERWGRYLLRQPSSMSISWSWEPTAARVCARLSSAG